MRFKRNSAPINFSLKSNQKSLPRIVAGIIEPGSLTPNNKNPAQSLQPPELLVERLDRSTLETVVSEMMAASDLNPARLRGDEESA